MVAVAPRPAAAGERAATVARAPQLDAMRAQDFGILDFEPWP